MRFFLAVIFLGGVLCLVNIAIIVFLRRKFRIGEEVVTEEIIPEEVKGDLEEDLEELRSLIRDGIKEIRGEIKYLEAAKEELKFLIQQSQQEIARWEGVIEKIHRFNEERVGKDGEDPQKQDVSPRDVVAARRAYIMSNPSNAKLRALMEKGLREEEIAQRLNIGIGELKLRMTLLEKEGLC